MGFEFHRFLANGDPSTSVRGGISHRLSPLNGAKARGLPILLPGCTGRPEILPPLFGGCFSGGPPIQSFSPRIWMAVAKYLRQYFGSHLWRTVPYPVLAESRPAWATSFHPEEVFLFRRVQNLRRRRLSAFVDAGVLSRALGVPTKRLEITNPSLAKPFKIVRHTFLLLFQNHGIAAATVNRSPSALARGEVTSILPLDSQASFLDQ